MEDTFNLDTLNVSRETKDLLNEYVALLTFWNSKINLVSKYSLDHIWKRHVFDSAQLLSFINGTEKTWLDIGSGAGFPGIVIAILSKEQLPHLNIILVDSDKRKSVFLREVARKLQLDIIVVSERIEDCETFSADIVSARALAPIKKLLHLFDLHSTLRGKGLFLKGKNFRSELASLENQGKFIMRVRPSLNDAEGFIIEVVKKGDC